MSTTTQIDLKSMTRDGKLVPEAVTAALAGSPKPLNSAVEATGVFHVLPSEAQAVVDALTVHMRKIVKENRGANMYREGKLRLVRTAVLEANPTASLPARIQAPKAPAAAAKKASAKGATKKAAAPKAGATKKAAAPKAAAPKAEKASKTAPAPTTGKTRRTPATRAAMMDETSAVRKWKEGGEVGPKPATPVCDEENAKLAKAS